MLFSLRTHWFFALAVAGVSAAFIALLASSDRLIGRVIQGDDLLRVQIESDWDRDGDVDFLDFTVFAAFYEEEV